LGYIKDSTVDDILVLEFIEEIFENYYIDFITEDVYRILSNAYYCLAKRNCLIDYPQIPNYDEWVHTFNRDDMIRISEEDIIMISESLQLRTEI
jgi:hypothetical protein